MGEVQQFLKLQKKLIRLVRVTSRRELFKALNKLPVPYMYIMEIMYYVEVNIT